MPLTIEDLEPLARKTIVLRGRNVDVRAMTARESLALHRQIPRPRPNLPHDAPRNHVLIEENHPSFKPHIERWIVMRRCAIAGIAAGISGVDGSWAEDRDAAWVRAYAESILERLTEWEIESIYRVAEAIEMGSITDLKDAIGTANHAGN